jgi:hypothetical protein
VGKCELNTWEWENSKVPCATLSIPYDRTLLMQVTQYPTCNLVMSQLYQMIAKLEMSIITYVHTVRKETITIQEALEKAVSPDMTKHILKTRTQMVEIIYKYFDTVVSESHRAKLYICTLLDPRFKNYNMWSTRKYVTIHTYAQCVCSVAKLNDRGCTRLTCSFFDSKKYNLEWGFQQLREVWTKDFKSSPTEEDDVEEDDVEMTGEGSGKVSRVDEDTFEKEVHLANETSAEEVRVSYVNPKALDQLEEWMEEKPIPYIFNDKFSQEGICQYWSGRLSGHAHVNQACHDIVRMWRQFHGCPASGGGIERVFFSAGKQHDAIKKKTMNKTLERTLKISINTKLSTYDDKGVFTDDDDTYRKRK